MDIAHPKILRGGDTERKRERERERANAMANNNQRALRKKYA